MLTCQKLRISAECWTSIGSSCHFFISFVVHIVSTCQTSARPELDFRDWTRETSETRDFQACCGRVMRMRRVISLSFDTCKDAHILKRFSKSFRHIWGILELPFSSGKWSRSIQPVARNDHTYKYHTNTIRIPSLAHRKMLDDGHVCYNDQLFTFTAFLRTFVPNCRCSGCICTH